MRRGGPSLIFFSDERFSFGKTTRVSYTETALSVMEISALFFSDTLFQVMFALEPRPFPHLTANNALFPLQSPRDLTQTIEEQLCYTK